MPRLPSNPTLCQSTFRRSSSHRSRAAESGFSLIEIMVVLVIIGLLAGVVTVNVRGYMIRAKQSVARTEISNVMSAIDTFYTLYDRYPTNEEGLMILTQKGEKNPEPFIKTVPVDPWGHVYQYNQPGRNDAYEVICFGADGKEGGDGADGDIASWDLKEHKAADRSTP